MSYQVHINARYLGEYSSLQALVVVLAPYMKVTGEHKIVHVMETCGNGFTRTLEKWVTK